MEAVRQVAQSRPCQRLQLRLLDCHFWLGGPGWERRTAPVYVFTKTATGWRTAADLKGSDTVTGDGFGSTLATSGTTAVVGAPESADNIGRAYLFKGTAKGWRQVAELKGTVAQGYFGSSVAMSGATAIVGSAPSSGAGSVHVGYPVSRGLGYLFKA